MAPKMPRILRCFTLLLTAFMLGLMVIVGIAIRRSSNNDQLRKSQYLEFSPLMTIKVCRSMKIVYTVIQAMIGAFCTFWLVCMFPMSKSFSSAVVKQSLTWCFTPEVLSSNLFIAIRFSYLRALYCSYSLQSIQNGRQYTHPDQLQSQIVWLRRAYQRYALLRHWIE